MSNEAKVGAFTVVGVVLLSAMLVFLSGVNIAGSKGYIINATFNHVIGLNKGAVVRLAGVNAGKVVSLTTDGKEVLVKMEILSDAKIPRDSSITVASSGFLGEKFISIMPGKDERNFLEDGDRVRGYGERGMDAAIDKANDVMDEVKTLLVAMNGIIGDPKLKDSMLGTTNNIKDMTANMREMTAVFARVAAHNEEELNMMVANLSQVTASLVRASQETEAMLHDFSGDGVTAANLRMTVANIAATSQRIDNMAKSLEGVVTNPQTAEDLQVTLHNARKVTEKADRMLGVLDGTNVTAGVDAMYSGKANKYMMNFDLTVAPSDKSFLLLGADDIGETNKFNAQVGMRGGAFTGRLGLVDSKVGLGIDADVGKYVRFSADAYDLNHRTLKLRTRVKVGKDTYLIGQMNDVTRCKDRTTFVGLRQEF